MHTVTLQQTVKLKYSHKHDSTEEILQVNFCDFEADVSCDYGCHLGCRQEEEVTYNINLL